MYIPDEEWDELNIFCCDLLEQLEAMPDDIFFTCKKEVIALCHVIINTQDRPNKITNTEIKFEKID